ncbi:MAG: hypothetical protein ACRDBO_16160 [Lachnospiraceae bacterium]
MSEFHDLPYYAFSGMSKMTVRCPKCNGMGYIKLDEKRRNAHFWCQECFISEEKVPHFESYEVSGMCEHCDRHYRVYLNKLSHHGRKVRVTCPHCNEQSVGEVTVRSQRYIYAKPGGGRDPYFHYQLYYQGHFRGELIWALNLEHLQYLIDYLKADLRKRPVGDLGHGKPPSGTMRTQADMLPTFMKTAKNREDIVKLLEKMKNNS